MRLQLVVGWLSLHKMHRTNTNCIFNCKTKVNICISVYQMNIYFCGFIIFFPKQTAKSLKLNDYSSEIHVLIYSLKFISCSSLLHTHECSGQYSKIYFFSTLCFQYINIYTFTFQQISPNCCGRLLLIIKLVIYNNPKTEIRIQQLHWMVYQ